MRKSFTSFAAFVFAALILAALGTGIWKQGSDLQPRLGDSFHIACVDREKVVKEGKIPSSLFLGCVAHVAREHEVSVVLDKRRVVTGALDLTDEVLKISRTAGKPMSSSDIFPPYQNLSPVGVVDQEKLFNQPDFREARLQYAKFFSELKKDYEEKARQGLSPAAKQQMALEYKARLSAYQEKHVAPLFKGLEREIKQAAKEKGVSLVFGRQDVLYGGVDITSLVTSRKEDLPVSSEQVSQTPGPDMAVLDVEKMITLSPSFFRVAELDREMASWKSGQYGIAETLLTPDLVAEWENARQQARKIWEKEASRIQDEAQGKDGVAVNQARQFLNKVYEQELEKKAKPMQEEFKQHVLMAEEVTRKELKAHAGQLLKERNQKLLGDRDRLFSALDVTLKKRAVELQEEYEKFESRLKGSADEEESRKKSEQEKLEKELLSLRDQELKKIGSKLKSEAASLDSQGQTEMKQYQEKLVADSREALKDEQQGLRQKLFEFRETALKKARKEAEARFGNSVTSASMSLLLSAGKSDLEEQRLRDEEASILARAPVYQEKIREIRSGKHEVVSDVVSGLEREKERVLGTIEEEIVQQSKSFAAKKAIPIILTGEVSNINALDLTREVSRELKPSISQGGEQLSK